MPRQTIKKLKSQKLPKAERSRLIRELLQETDLRTNKRWTMTSIGKILGISRQRVHQLASGYASN